MNQATRTQVIAHIDPGERSIPLVMITNVSPMAIIPNMAICRVSICRLYPERKRGFNTAVAAARNISATRMPASRILRTFVRFIICYGLIPVFARNEN